MVTTRISPKHQITIPKPVFDEAQLKEGEILEASVENGKIVLTPERLTDKTQNSKLTLKEQTILARAKAKIDKINNDILNSKGLTLKEIEVAAKADLIDEKQAYYWTEEWQKGERESERAILNGEVSPAFNNSDEAIAYLRRESAKI